jgi:hypothetical protein
MAWTSMHFATGMACSGAAGVIGCALVRRGWRWIPTVMTLGGLWACVPDMPRLWRVDFPWLPLSSTLGQMDLERYLHSIGNIFFFHAALDAPPKHEYALHGVIGMIVLYNAAIVLLMWLEARRRKDAGSRAWVAHAAYLAQRQRNVPPHNAAPTVTLGLSAGREGIGRASPELQPLLDLPHTRSSHLSHVT